MSFFFHLLTAESGIPPAFTSNAVFWMDTSRLSSMFQEGGTGGSTGNAVTPVTANGNPVGFMYDMSPNSLYCRASAAAGNFPLLGSDATRNGFLTFDGINDRIFGQSISFFNNIHSPNPVFTLCFWIKFNGGDATNQIIFTNNNLSTTNGFALYRSNTNKLIWQTYVGGVNKSTKTSTQNVTTATGWVPVFISMNGVGAGKGRMIIGDIEDATFDVSAGSVADATQVLYIGSRSSNVQWLNASIGDIMIFPTAATDELITAFKAYNPTRTTDEFTPVLESKYDFTDTTKMFSDAAGTTPVVPDAIVRLVRSGHTETWGDCGRRLTAASDVVAPIYRANQVNGLGSLEYDGVDSAMTFNYPLCGELGGKYVVFVVCRNRDATNGSHVMSASSTSGRYMALTGENYSGAFNDPYFVAHSSEPAGVVGQVTVDTTDAEFKLCVFKRNGTTLEMWNSDKAKATDLNVGGSIVFHQIGPNYDDPAFPLWWFDGFDTLKEKWNGNMSVAAIEAKIDELKATFGIN